MDAVGEHVGVGDWRRLADWRGHDVVHDELSTRIGVSHLPHIPDVGGHDDE